jgi:cell division protein FtsQ
VFALRSGKRPGAGAARFVPFGFSFFEDGFVVPRLLRRPVRLLARITDGDFEAPRFSATILSSALLAASALYGAYAGGHMPAVIQAVTAHSGFAVDQVQVSGHRETSEIDVLGALRLDGWTSLVGFDVEAARERVAALPWVETASVRKIYPDTLEVGIAERKPFAIWQHGSGLSLIEASGHVIAPFSGGRFAALPLVLGIGADKAAASFVRKVEGYPGLASRVKGYIRVAERRWDLRLENGITVKLPERDEDAAINELLAMDRENGLLSRDILAVDLRLDDRVVVELTPDAQANRLAALKSQGFKIASEKKI